MKANWRYVLGIFTARTSCFSLALLIFFQIEAQEIKLTGRVVDHSSNPVANVDIRLNAAQISTVTGGSGDFSLIRSATGLPDLIRNPQGHCSFDGRKLLLFCRGETVGINIFDLSGRLYAQILKPTKLSGEYLVYPSAYISSEQPLIYILRVSVGKDLACYKLMHYNDMHYDKGVELISRNMPAALVPQFKRSANTIDTLIFSHSSYRTKKISISAYVHDVGTVQLEDTLIIIAAPTSLAVEAVSAGQIDLVWTDNADNETGFRIERSLDGSTGWKLIAVLRANSSSHQDTDLSPSTLYYYRVHAFNAGSNSRYSNTAHVSTKKLDYSFKGGDLADLRAVSPDLIFGDLSIDGRLYLRPSDSSVVFTVDNMRINEKVRSTYPFIFYDPNAPEVSINTPELTINAEGSVWVNAPILLHGWWGAAIPPEVTWISCEGTDGGDLTINSTNIYVNMPIHTYGGDGAFIDQGNGVLYGCHAGDGGNIFLNAVDSLYVSASGSSWKLEGGNAQDSTNSIRGNNGLDGILDLEGQHIGVEEIKLGSAEENMYDYNAQLLEYEKMTVYGHCTYREEHEHRNDDGTWYIYLGFANVDWIEDIYLLHNTGEGIKIDLATDDPLCDLDLFLTTPGGKILRSSKGPSGTESINNELAAPGYYWIWVSYKDDGPDRSTDYTLKFKQ